MSLAIAGGVVNAGLSIMAANARNAAIENTANQNFNTTLAMVDQELGVNVAGLYDKAQELNSKVGLQLTDLLYKEKAASATQVAANVESNIYGQTAARRNNAIKMDAALMEDNIIQAGEAAMKDIQIGMSNAKYNRDSGIYRASIQRASAINQMASPFEIAAGAFSAGMSGANAGAQLG